MVTQISRCSSENVLELILLWKVGFIHFIYISSDMKIRWLQDIEMYSLFEAILSYETDIIE